MSRLKKLYESTILDHNKNPRNFRVISPCSNSSHGKNPLCGDDYFVFLDIKEGIIEDISFHGSGCAISMSSGSLMTTHLKGKTVDYAYQNKDVFLKMVSKDMTSEEKKILGKLSVFEGVKDYPVRVKCAALVWRALEDALGKNKGEISTE
ncbi:MAG: SUF system NifU family Fe-S cluster assembly protein [bacterium]|nr:SUF system NifU family Fe-S cluster assembly protein [bacterium]